MTKLYYRFRTVDGLLGNRKELERQIIYFASPHQLNDPMEGLRDIVWKGDEIVWKNLFRHYLLCLKSVCFLSLLQDEDNIFREEDIPVFSSLSSLPTDKMRSLYSDIADDVFSDPDVSAYVHRLSKVNRAIRREELAFHLQNLHFKFLTVVFRKFIDFGLMSDSSRSVLAKYTRLSDVLHSDFFDNLEEVGEEGKVGALFSAVRMTHARYIFTAGLGSPESGNKKSFLYLQFAEAYVRQLEKIMFPNWYAACFMTTCNNSAVWGHYGDSHKGVCLVYEADGDGTTDSILLRGIVGTGSGGHIWGQVRMPLHRIEYIDGLKQIDFFRSIGQISIPELEKTWYSDNTGNFSVVGNHLREGEEKWCESYWKSFFDDITKKTDDWAYENEYRLILQSSIVDLSQAENRTFQYNFSSLKGIIFGINTSNESKREIIRIVEEKCKSEGVAEFVFYQAFYSPKNRRIDHYKLHSFEPKFGCAES